MTDLQCPTTVLFIAREALGRVAHEERLAGVFVTASVIEDPDTSEKLAALASCPIAWLAASDAAGLREEIDHLGDLYRGETIAVVATAQQTRELLGTARELGVLAVAIDSSGWALVRAD